MGLLSIIKHLPGRHTQKRHAGTVGGSASFSEAIQGRVVNSKPIGEDMSSNEAQLLTFEDGTQAVWKQWNGNDSISEVMVKQVADHIGMQDLVPATDVMTGDRFGTVQEFVGDAKTGAELQPMQKQSIIDIMSGMEARYEMIQDVYKNHPDAPKIALLDYVTAQQDRHVGNWMKTSDNRLKAIDNGMAFNNYFTDSPFHKAQIGKPVPQATLSKLKTIKREDVDGIFKNMRYTAFQTMAVESSFGGKPPQQVYADGMWERIQKVIAEERIPAE